MRTLFSAHIPPDDAFFQFLWTEAVIVIDTNVMLNLYRFSDGTRDEFLAVLDQLRGRLWVPNQVVWEFFGRRSAAMTDNEREVLKGLKKAKEALDESKEGLRGRLADTHHLDDVSAVISSKIQEVETARNSRLALYNDPKEPILKKVLDLFDGRVGATPDPQWLSERFKEGAARYSSETPPGYKDRAAKKGEPERSLYGDYLLWVEVLTNSKTQDKPAILVTNDQKEDWFEESSGRKLGPRRELLEEFQRSTGKPCWIYNVGRFLEHAQRFISAKASATTIREVETLATLLGLESTRGFHSAWRKQSGKVTHTDVPSLTHWYLQHLRSQRDIEEVVRAYGAQSREAQRAAEALQRAVSKTILLDRGQTLLHPTKGAEKKVVVARRREPPAPTGDSDDGGKSDP